MSSKGGEIPVTKLAALQKVLQSDFLNAVREIYEHIYETVDIQVFFLFQYCFSFLLTYSYKYEQVSQLTIPLYFRDLKM